MARQLHPGYHERMPVVKRYSLALVLLLMLSRPTIGAAQLGSVSLGALIGYSRAGLVGDDAQGLTSSAATLAGAYVRIPVASWFAVEPELLFARKGGSSLALPGQTTGDLDFEFVYLEVPVLARFATVLGKFIRPVLFAGPSVAFIIGCDVQLNGAGGPVRQPCDTASVTSVDASAVIGGGFELGLGNSVLGVEFRYIRGLRQVTTQPLDIKNSLWGILAEIPFSGIRTPGLRLDSAQYAAGPAGTARPGDGWKSHLARRGIRGVGRRPPLAEPSPARDRHRRHHVRTRHPGQQPNRARTSAHPRAGSCATIRTLGTILHSRLSRGQPDGAVAGRTFLL